MEPTDTHPTPDHASPPTGTPLSTRETVYNYDGPHDPLLPTVDPKKKWYRLPFIPFLIGALLLVSLSGAVYAPKNPKIHTIVQRVLADVPGMHTESTSEVTSDTVIASTLDVPQLDPSTYWAQVPPESLDNSLNTLYTPDARPVATMKGKFWTAETTDDTTMSVMEYYSTALKKAGWLAAGGVGALHFSDFTLAGPAASGTCARMSNFLGYKDDLVRMVTVWGQTVPCDQGKPGKNAATDYTVFVSDPMPLKDIIVAIDNR